MISRWQRSDRASIEFILEKHSSNSSRSTRLEIHRHRKNNRKLSSVERRGSKVKRARDCLSRALIEICLFRNDVEHNRKGTGSVSSDSELFILTRYLSSPLDQMAGNSSNGMNQVWSRITSIILPIFPRAYSFPPFPPPPYKNTKDIFWGTKKSIRILFGPMYQHIFDATLEFVSFSLLNFFPCIIFDK